MAEHIILIQIKKYFKWEEFIHKTALINESLTINHSVENFC